ncbi:50S ribosomal protein L19 [bacterium (Candidatus Blackallbacteria) CG17_big_fil_post_rev_8_21_14_2_50_48_46]|uniref:Large ribosomal subunit protein bL19 n=1 Tax=bacterium (Candidatus Blackallbacteria) CG17_big_fil_post_rev_8_21_14_2_50_48_46 TaxID=2014261 RepID=A0A2M7G8V3_9BACT|nr:MAG: 50S ribosomal protein L19 [bacterium (Candidatus Blackallbacteria) CG18_big_fil_WC_8_21_14_2_50_49_26]PIW18540.1 MAG: 50S ribosomal protein L19 [bacterium (Candidatus Blackallbacteria) CG17_big_fil_post_rev_8_21_14_2_50_48_46]PIW46475.1 MAG: 50S ribosomal protein L19 [bacterium (Candidatus Blackallbacteria) CG13_big_fil_rev_8_21_14_2_50_49_14]
MSQQLMREITQSQLKDDVPTMSSGDTVAVHAKIVEGGKERVQVFEGVVIKLQGSGISQTVTVRKMFQGIGVERTFLIHSPRVAKFVLKRKGAVRRARIYYFRSRSGKSARIREKR